MGALSVACVVLGTVCVAVGLYRRDPTAQRIALRGLAWAQRNVLRRRPEPVRLEMPLIDSGQAFPPRFSPKPAKLAPDADPAEIVAWLERHVAYVEEELEVLRVEQRDQLREVDGKLSMLEHTVAGGEAELRRMIREATVPERWEWVGVTFLLAGAVLGGLDVATQR